MEPYLKRKGYTVKMPEFVQKDTNGQLTTAQANSSRLVTACRFVVEMRNGHLKNIFRLFYRRLTTYELPHIMSDLRIAASLINKFFVTIESNRHDADTIARNMLQRCGKQNELAVYIHGKAFNKSMKKFVEAMDDHVKKFIFPQVAKNEFRLIALGNYQPKLALSYIHQQIKTFGEFKFFILPEEITKTIFQNFIQKYNIQSPVLVLADFKSRYRSTVKHKAYILADQNVRGREGIVSYFCNCQNGRRLVGSCSHILAFIAFLSYYRFHTKEIKGVSEFIDDFFEKVHPELSEQQL